MVTRENFFDDVFEVLIDLDLRICSIAKNSKTNNVKKSSQKKFLQNMRNFDDLSSA